MRRATPFAVTFLALTFATGCALNKPYSAKDTFVIRAGKVRVAPTARPEVLKVEKVTVSAPFDERGLVFRTADSAMTPDYYNVFAADPGDLLTGELVRMLAESAVFSGVVEPSSTATPGLRLECIVTDFYADVRDAATRRAVCRARFRLLREQPGVTTIVGDWAFEQNAPVAADSGAAAAAGLGAAFGSVVNDFVRQASQ